MDPLATIESDLASLMTAPLEEFTGRRDGLVRDLRDRDERELAATVAGLRRPSPALWAVNRIARDHPDLIARLLDTGEALRRAQGRMLAGQEAADIIESAEAHRQAVTEALEAGREELRSAGRPVTGAMTDRIRETLVGASLAETTRDPLRGARLITEVPAASLGFAVAAPSNGAPTARTTVAEVRRATGGALKERARRRAEAEEALADAERLRDGAQGRLAQAQDERDEIERQSVEAGRRRVEAERRMQDAEAALAKARVEADRVVRETTRLAESAARARASEELAQTALDDARESVMRARRRLRLLDREGGPA